MSQPKHNKEPSLELFFETVHGFQRTSALKAAIELDVFTAISAGTDTPEALSKRCQASERGMRILCDYLVVFGFLTKTGKRYDLTGNSNMFLDRSSPAFVGTAVEFLLSQPQFEAFKDLTAVVRRGGTVMGEGVLAPEHPVWVQFARAMAPLMKLPSELLAESLGSSSGTKWRVLDVAAGHGLYGIAIAKKNSHAEIVAQDWPNVLELAVENAKAMGVAGRLRTLPGNAFDVEFGSGYDLVLLTNFLHHFDPATIQKFLSKVYVALKPGGRTVILEFIPNEDRVSPRVPAQFAMMMLATTPSGDAYTFSDYDRILRDVGFSRSELRELQPTYFRVVIAYK